MIAIDNSVELTVKTYLGLPRRITGLKLSRREFGQISESFPSLLDALEEHASDKLVGIDLGEIEWYHRLRNQLYHQGNGLTVERTKVDVYSELAKLLLGNLFEVYIGTRSSESGDQLGPFLSNWIELERSITKLARQYRSDLTGTGNRLPVPMIAFQGLAGIGVIPKKLSRRIDYYRAIRNRLVHAEGNASDLLEANSVGELQSIREQLDIIRETEA